MTEKALFEFLFGYTLTESQAKIVKDLTDDEAETFYLIAMGAKWFMFEVEYIQGLLDKSLLCREGGDVVIPYPVLRDWDRPDQ